MNFHKIKHYLEALVHPYIHLHFWILIHFTYYLIRIRELKTIFFLHKSNFFLNYVVIRAKNFPQDEIQNIGIIFRKGILLLLISIFSFIVLFLKRFFLKKNYENLKICIINRNYEVLNNLKTYILLRST